VATGFVLGMTGLDSLFSGFGLPPAVHYALGGVAVGGIVDNVDTWTGLTQHVDGDYFMFGLYALGGGVAANVLFPRTAA